MGGELKVSGARYISHPSLIERRVVVRVQCRGGYPRIVPQSILVVSARGWKAPLLQGSRSY